MALNQNAVDDFAAFILVGIEGSFGGILDKFTENSVSNIKGGSTDTGSVQFSSLFSCRVTFIKELDYIKELPPLSPVFAGKRRHFVCRIVSAHHCSLLRTENNRFPTLSALSLSIAHAAAGLLYAVVFGAKEK